MTNCATIREALASIRSLEELEGFTAALRNPALATKTPTQEEWQEMARLKIEMQKQEAKA